MLILYTFLKLMKNVHEDILKENRNIIQNISDNNNININNNNNNISGEKNSPHIYIRKHNIVVNNDNKRKIFINMNNNNDINNKNMDNNILETNKSQNNNNINNNTANSQLHILNSNGIIEPFKINIQEDATNNNNNNKYNDNSLNTSTLSITESNKSIFIQDILSIPINFKKN